MVTGLARNPRSPIIIMENTHKKRHTRNTHTHTYTHTRTRVRAAAPSGVVAIRTGLWTDRVVASSPSLASERASCRQGLAFSLEDSLLSQPNTKFEHLWYNYIPTNLLDIIFDN
jgi:hypothetical protein